MKPAVAVLLGFLVASQPSIAREAFDREAVGFLIDSCKALVSVYDYEDAEVLRQFNRNLQYYDGYDESAPLAEPTRADAMLAGYCVGTVHAYLNAAPGLMEGISGLFGGEKCAHKPKDWFDLAKRVANGRINRYRTEDRYKFLSDAYCGR